MLSLVLAPYYIMLPLCCLALFRAKAIPNTVTLYTVQLAIANATNNLKDIVKIHNGRCRAYNNITLLCASHEQAVEKKRVGSWH